MYNYRSGHPSQMRSSHSDYFRDAESGGNAVNAGQHFYCRHPNLTVTTTATTARQQLAAVRMSQAGYPSNASGAGGGGGHSMQPSHGAHHQAPTQQPQQQQQSMPPPHAGMSYHQQQQQQQQQQQPQASGPPYVIGPGQYSGTQPQFASYRQQQPTYQQHQTAGQPQQPQPAGRPAFVGINAIPTSTAPRMPSNQPPYLVQQQQQSSQAIRMQQQPQSALVAAMQQSPGQGTFMPARSVAVSSAHHQPGQPQLISGNIVQPQLVRLQQPPQQHQSPQQVLHQVGGNARMAGSGQVQVTIATPATSSGLMMQQAQYGQGVYQQRPLVVQQQPIIIQQQPQTANVLVSQQQPQPTNIQYQYRPQQQMLQPQSQPQTPSQQQASAMQKQQAAPSPSSVSSTSSTPAAQFATPNQLLTKSDIAGATSTPSPASISTAGPSGAAASNTISDSSTAGYAGVQSDSSQVLTKQRLEDLVREVDPYEQLDEDVKETLLQIADEFIESVVSGACQIAKHRKASAVDVKDVQLCLERNWNMWIPGFGTDDIRPYKKACVTDAHKQRMALIKKTMKKI